MWRAIERERWQQSRLGLAAMVALFEGGHPSLPGTKVSHAEKGMGIEFQESGSAVLPAVDLEQS